MADFTVEFGKTGKPAEPDGRLDGRAFHRNREPIWSAIGGYMQTITGDVLELGSGTGQHAADYAGRVPNIVWWPSDIMPSHLASIAAWREHSRLENLRAPQRIDLTDPDWTWTNDSGTSQPLAAMFCGNVLHISPWTVSLNLIAGAGHLLRPGGRLFIYGPFKRDGAHTAQSNAAFDASLRAENPAWGVRDVSDIAALAADAGLNGPEIMPMPANNLVLAFAQPLRQN